ncbi:MAG: transposase [Clostridiales bacterium]|nr:transposase [Clostridiales bacterium]
MGRKLAKSEAENAALHAQIIDNRNKWMEVNEDVVKEKEEALAAKDKELEKMRQKLYETERKLDEARDELREEKKRTYEALTEVEDLQGQILKLTARLSKDYTNSSKPSSADPNHKKIPNSRESTGRKPGGQPGHPHHPRKRLEPTKTVEIPAPEEYANNTDRYLPTGRMVTRQLILLYVKADAIDYCTREFIDLQTGKTVHAAFPAGVDNDVNFDSTVKAAALLLNAQCNVSIGKTQKFLKEISDGAIDMSTGMICGLSAEFSAKTEEERQQIFNDLLNQPVMHTDFTFGRVNGTQGAVIICDANGLVLYQGREKKGHEGIKGSPVELYKGTLVCDHDPAFQRYGNGHQECMSHVLRYLTGSIENEPDRTWNKDLRTLIREMIHANNEAREKGEALEEAQIEQFEAKFKETVASGMEEYEYIPPSEYYRDGYNLAKRLHENPEDYLRFLRNPNIESNNSAAERDARKFKRKAHQVMSFRSQEGMNHFCDGLTIMQTLEASGENLYKAIASRFDNVAVTAGAE